MAILDPHWPRAGAWLAGEAPDAEVLVVGVPNSRSSLSPSRADMTPLAVRDRLDRFSTYHGEMDIDFSTVPVKDMGNWPVSETEPVDLLSQLPELASQLPEAPLTLFIGGDNAITRPLVGARSDDMTTVGLITFDAHHDVREYDEPTNGSPIRGLVEEHGLPGAHVVQIGIHSFANSAAYRSWCDDAGITTVTVEQVEKIGMRAAVDVAVSQLSALCDQIYVDVDVDVLDRSFAPGCPGSRPGGLTIRQLSEGVARCAAHHSVTAMDFVEVDAEADRDSLTVDATAHLLLTAIAGYATR